MAPYQTPGVYVEEISTLPGSIASVPTAVPAFIGYTKLNTGQIARVESFADFVRIFGGANPTLSIDLSVSAPVLSGPTTAAVPMGLLYYCLQHYFINGGGPCYVASTGAFTPTPATTEFTTALTALESYSEPTLIVIPDAALLGTTANHKTVYEAAITHATKMMDRFVLVDPWGADRSDLDAAQDHIRDIAGSSTLDLSYAASYFPYIVTTLKYPESSVKISGGTHNNQTLEYVMLNDPSHASLPVKLGKIQEQLAALPPILLPPSATIAGVYCATDNARGVWKAPANVGLAATTGFTYRISDEGNAILNIDDTGGKSINALRTFAGIGHMVWGARTMDGNDNEWRYVPVRRLFITMEESIKLALESVVFSTNDHSTWARVKAMIENYLNGIWRQGGLAGTKPEHAYYVKVGLDSTMTPLDILEGRLIVEIGAAAVRPAEFIVLRFSHLLQTA